jgi:transglutaminase-like putative cysteine protease
MKNKLACLAVLLGSFGVGQATAEPSLDLQHRYPLYHATIVINADGTAVESREWSITVLKESALEWAKQASISYSTSAQKAEVVAAYTRKADGRRIEVPKDNYQLQVNRGKGKESPVFSDFSTMTVVFPDLAVGDTVVFSYRVVQTEPLFPGHFSLAETLHSQMAFDDVRVRIDYPATMPLQLEARGMTEKPRSEKGGRRVVEWRYANPNPARGERRNFTVFDFDKEAGFSVSTFKTYAEIASAYGSRALPKAAVTDRIRKLAAEIVKEKRTVKDQAHALYEWVATNVTYAGNCIGIGAVVPRELNFVLDNKMGDCKDHATLLQALLAARGIRSNQALVNAGPVYRLPKVPVASHVNHVITYIPALDLYLDSTSDSTPFGMLPFQVQDKPVLLVGVSRDGAKTPADPVGSNQERTVTRLKIAPDGSVSGTSEVFQKGQNAAQTRAMARTMTREVEQDLVKNMLRSQGMIGNGKFEKDDPKALSDSYKYKASLSVEKFARVPGPGALSIHPLVSGASIASVVLSSMEPEKAAEIVCSNGTAIEEYTIEFPAGVKVLSVPDDVKISNAFLSYEAKYKLEGSVVSARRVLDDRTKGNVCAPDTMLEYKRFAEKVMDDLKAQILYK